MADRPDAYVRKDPGDIIRSGDWNELQIRAREDIRGHKHTGGDDGTLIPRAGIEANAIDGSRIDPGADVTVKTLTTSGNLAVKGDLSVNGKAILGDIADLLSTVKALQRDKLNRAGDTVTGALNIQKNLFVAGGIAIGSANPPRELLDVNGRIQAGTLTIGPWSRDPSWVCFGTNALDQSKEGNYALLQCSSGDYLGWTLLNSPKTIRFRIDNGEKMVLTNNGNVGIGTPNPVERLNVTGNILLTAPDKNIYSLSLERIDENERSHKWSFWHMNTQYGQNDLQLWEYKTDKSGKSCGGDSNDGAMCTPRLIIKEGGNVGIGTRTPSEKLEINGRIKVGALSIGPWLGDPANWVCFGTNALDQSKAGNYALLQGSSGDYLGWTLLNSPKTIRFRIDNAEKMVLTSDGNVGIGQPSPAYTLDVNGSVRLGGFTDADADEWPKVVWCRGSGAWDEGLIKHSSQRGFFKRSGFGIHIDQSRDWGVWSSNWTPLLGVEGGTGNTNIRGTLIRKIRMSTGLGPVDETDNGQIVSRVLSFTKYHADTAIRIFYCDNLRVYGNNVAARWEIRIDGLSAPGGAIFQDKYGVSGNFHEPATILGYASGISAGNHTIGVWVSPVPGYAVDAYTGWLNSRWTLEAQEVWL